MEDLSDPVTAATGPRVAALVAKLQASVLPLIRLLRLALLAGVIAVIVVTTATADTPVCTHGVSSVGPVTLTHGQVRGVTTPHTEVCLP
jgi:ribosomal protein S12 methylthiotransferase accessory factor YcaO